MTMSNNDLSIPVYFHPDQLNHKPLYEWAFGDKIDHPETTSRAESIYNELLKEPGLFDIRRPEGYPTKSLKDTHNESLMKLYHTAEALPPEQTYYPSIFPNREVAKGDPTNIRHAGFFCYDSGTPLNASTWTAAAWSAACADQAAALMETGKVPVAYSLCRPPGHHASRNLFGGYCYFNNAAIGAKRLRKFGKIAILDIDFHHGNGTQSIFYRDPDVLNVSIHGDPKAFYPFFSGFLEETGMGKGVGFNKNIPLPEKTDGQEYLKVLKKEALSEITKYQPKVLIISAGFDTYKEDPVGDFSLETDDFFDVGLEIARLKLPLLVVQEGGYHSPTLGKNVSSFLHGVVEGIKSVKNSKTKGS